MRFHGSSQRGSSAASTNGATSHEAGKVVSKNVEDVVRIEDADRQGMGWSDHTADGITALAGSMTFVFLHLLWFGGWIIWNSGWLGLPAFDEPPFGLLTIIVSLEAIFLSTFVLISQNREAKQADRRARLDLQINMLAEQEVTRLTKMVAEIHEHLGLDDGEDDEELEEMKQPVKVEDLVKAVDIAEGDS
jgi:uncharacterized membrane protein